MKLRPLLVAAVALVALFGTLWRQRQEASRPPDQWEPVSFS
ncbi:MAG TPA: hypothetical protein VJR05_08575 [Acidimicrobiia bacterium]|nr:hypothetical protein [Acidimicrobiia bacterium]